MLAKATAERDAHIRTALDWDQFGMCACMFVCMHVCMHVSLYRESVVHFVGANLVCMHVYLYVCMCMLTRDAKEREMHICIRLYMYACTYACMFFICDRTYMCMIAKATAERETYMHTAFDWDQFGVYACMFVHMYVYAR